MIEHPHSGQQTVLLIEDGAQIIEMVSTALSKANYKVVAAHSARQAFTDIFKSPPDIIILDINLPDLDGFHVARELKRNMMLRHIPVILLSSRVDFLEKMRSLDVIVDEFLVKPFEVQDLVVRTKLVLDRVQSNLDANPLTRLPGNIAIVKALKSRIGQGQPYAVGYADLNNFKAFNDKYGFSKGDQIIKFTAQLIVAAVQKLSSSDSFVGHVGGDDFIFVCGYEQANEICQFITERFDAEIPKYYSEEDRKKGYITVEDRRGVISQFPIMSIAIGLVSDEGKKFSNLGQVNHSLTQLKKYAKSFQGSAYVRDRRSLANQLAEFTWGPGSTVGPSKVLDNIANALGSYLPTQLLEILNNKTITVLFQPILDMRVDEVMGHESLVRGPVGTPLEFPDALFQTARTANRVLDLDILCIKKIVSAAQEFRKGIKLFINIFPETLLEDEMLYKEVLQDPLFTNLDVIFELSGSQRSQEAPDLFLSLHRLKEKGFKIALDGSVVLQGRGLEFLPTLRPDYIKLNMIAYKDMAQDADRRDDFIRTVNLVRQVSSEIICTKLESRSDAFIALKAGVFYGQGFLFARPVQSQPSVSVK